ncbi:nucleotide exchange factor GrpE [Kangiella sp. HZ709]|uniref:nucleotide exchange factor GrpE n=1 Tax=Kangiella sp. HZ709 TaxID=2666328 RepID=UPI0012AF977F|nr:nucleotide exchange factor GrpE [Kangiella sp. HZ709]MRX27810.1 nucleotide exchange factor GrpE [Kangiella sp. HZ709]
MSEKDVKNQEDIKAAQDAAVETAAEQVQDIMADLGEELLGEELTGDAARIDELEKALEEAEAKAAENMELALRTKAEAENIRRRSENEVSNARKFAIEKFANEMLAVVDSLEQGLAQKAEHEESIAMKEGMELTLKMTLSTLEKFGIEQLNPIEEVFDPQLHEAMTMVPSPAHESNTVIDVFQKGYSLNGRLIRPARVVVAQ